MLAIAAMILCASALRAQPPSIPAYSQALEDRVGPHGRDVQIAIYRRGEQVLVFVAAHHAFDHDNPTMRAVDAAYAIAAPRYVIVEGFPTALGENPAPIVALVRQHDKPDAPTFARSEPVHAAWLAMAHGVHFIGGEPTDAEQVDALVAKGYTRADIMFAYLVRDIGQSVRAGEIADAGDAKFADRFSFYAKADARDLHGQEMTLAEFAARYCAAFGMDYTADPKLEVEADPGLDTLVGHVLRDDMVVRDAHIFEAIKSALAAHHSVMIVYGGSHWTTLSAALEHWLGKPETRVID